MCGFYGCMVFWVLYFFIKIAFSVMYQFKNICFFDFVKFQINVIEKKFKKEK